MEESSKLERQITLSLQRLLPRLEARFSETAALDPKGWEGFIERLRVNFPQLFRLQTNTISFTI
jgi:hypothetical protein